MAAVLTFLNVGHGDCSLLYDQATRWTIMLDAGTRHGIASHLDAIDHSVPRVDLLVGTHYDVDHLEGLIEVVQRLGGQRIGEAILPPILHPTGDREGSFRLWLSEHLRDDGLGNALRPFNAMVRESLLEPGRRLEELAAEMPNHDRQALEVNYDEMDALSDDAIDEWPLVADLPSADAMRTASTVLMSVGLDAIGEMTNVAAELSARQLWNRVQPEMRLTTTFGSRVARAVLFVAQTGYTAVVLDRLVRALQAEHIPFTTPTAPDRVMMHPAPINVWHISPRVQYVRWLWKHVPQAVTALMELKDLNTTLSTASNRLSHVMLFEPMPTCGVLLTGDSNFIQARGPVPDSMSAGWDSLVGRVSLVDIPHHGGRWGHFGMRFGQALSPSRVALTGYVSVSQGATRPPPGPKLAGIGHAWRSARGHSVSIVLSNRPAAVLLGPDLDQRLTPRIAAGPPSVHFLSSPRGWHLDRRSQPLVADYI